MADDPLAQLRPEGGWWTAVTGPGSAAEMLDEVLDDHARTWPTGPVGERGTDRWLLACVDRGHVRWRGDGTRRVATRSCAHTDHHADVTDPVAELLAAGDAHRTGTANQGTVQLTTNGRRRLADLERAARHG